mgnify:CR=1 FL=1
MADWFGINYPFKGGVQNFLSRQVGIRIVKNDILQLLLTNPGERVYRPNFGVGLRLYLFEQEDDTSVSGLRSTIIDQISIYEKRVTLDTLDIKRQSDLNTLKLHMEFTLIQDPDEQFEIDLNLPIVSET